MSWILDVIFFVVLIGGCLVGVKVGFVKGVCRIAGWVLSFIVPFVFCAAFKDALESWFGMVSAIQSGIGTTIGGWVSMGISFILLFILVRLGTWLLGKIGTALTDSSKIFSAINQIFGGLLGIAEAFLFCYFLLLVCNWLPLDNVHTFIEGSTVVGAIYHSNLMAYLPF